MYGLDGELGRRCRDDLTAASPAVLPGQYEGLNKRLQGTRAGRNNRFTVPGPRCCFRPEVFLIVGVGESEIIRGWDLGVNTNLLMFHRRFMYGVLREHYF